MKLNSVQYLRAIAALLVVAFHASGNMGIGRNFNMLGYGQYGVDLFFVISGFIMMVTTASNPSASSFMVKRLWRIVPLYWLVTSAYVVILILAPYLLRSETLDFGFIIKSFLFIPTHNPKFPHFIWPLVIPGWSLNYELFFYALFGASLLLSATYRGALSALTIVLLVAVGKLITTHDAIAVTYTNELLLEFVFGIVIGSVFLRPDAKAFSALSLCFFFAAALAIYLNIEGVMVGRSLLFGSVSGAVLCGALLFERRGLKFSNVLLIAIGDASYSIYLSHPAVIVFFRWFGHVLHVGKVNALGGITVLAAILIVASLLGWSIFTLIERPLIVRRNVLLARFSRPRSAHNEVA